MNETGKEVSSSGIYRVHHEEHRLPREVVLIAGNRFPRCGKCSNAVRFELVKTTGGKRSNVVVHELSVHDENRNQLRVA